MTIRALIGRLLGIAPCRRAHTTGNGQTVVVNVQADTTDFNAKIDAALQRVAHLREQIDSSPLSER